MYFHLILTDDCNLCCRYCRAKAFEVEDAAAPETGKIEIDADLSPDLSYDPDCSTGSLHGTPHLLSLFMVANHSFGQHWSNGLSVKRRCNSL